MKSISRLMFALCVGLASGAYAVANDITHGAASPVAPWAAGEVKKVDKDARKITLKHGELKNLDMPPMTMVFQVQDPATLDKVKVGDKIGFLAEKIGGRLTVTRIDVKHQ